MKIVDSDELNERERFVKEKLLKSDSIGSKVLKSYFKIQTPGGLVPAEKVDEYIKENYLSSSEGNLLRIVASCFGQYKINITEVFSQFGSENGKLALEFIKDSLKIDS